jgi:hypothetical protein
VPASYTLVVGSRALLVGLFAALVGCGLDLTGAGLRDGADAGVAGRGDAASPGPFEGADGGDEAGSDSGAADARATEGGAADARATEGGVVDAGADVQGSGVASIAFSVVINPPDRDLTRDGALDWAHWGDQADGSPVHKVNGGGVIGSFTVTGAACDDSQGVAWPVKATWSDGTPQASSPPTNLHRRFYGSTGLTVSLSLACDGASHLFTVDLGGWASQARFEASFDNIPISPPVEDTRGNATGYYAARYAVTYLCPVATRLVVRWVATDLPAASFCAGSDLILASATLR